MDAIFAFKREDEQDLYQILGCDELSTRDQILCEFKVKALECHPDKNPEDCDAEKKFKDLQKAKAILTDPEKRVRYDKWRMSGMSMSFEQWANLSKNAHTSMHWVNRKKGDPMIESASSSSSSVSSPFQKDAERGHPLRWESDSHEQLRRFRNYQL